VGLHTLTYLTARRLNKMKGVKTKEAEERRKKK